MYRQCTTQKTTQQQLQFIEALQTSLQTRFYRDITITDLCKQTGLTRNVFYRLFDCKDDILYALIDNYFYACSQSISANHMQQSLISFFSFWKENKSLLDILEKNQLNHLLASRGTLCCKQIDFGMQKYIHANWNEYDDEIFSFYVGGFIGLLFLWYHSGFKKSEEEMAELSIRLLSHPPLMVN